LKPHANPVITPEQPGGPVFANGIRIIMRKVVSNFAYFDTPGTLPGIVIPGFPIKLMQNRVYMAEKLFLIDGTALAYRSYFAMINSNLRNSEGIPTGAIYGFANALVNLMEKEEPTHLAVAWDTHAPTFRHDMDENYKANRPPQPEDLRTSIPLIKEMVELFGFTNLEKDGYEADDIIGTLATRAKKEQVTVYMITPDKDFMQLVGDNIYMFKPLNKGEGFELIDRNGVIDYFGVGPEAVTDVLALIGDTSDNIPGVPGIGKKGAAKIIQEHGSLEKAIESAPAMKNKRAREGLSTHHEQALKSREMIVINTDVPDTVHWQELRWHGVEAEKLVSYFKRMQFRNLTRKIATLEGRLLEPTRERLPVSGQGSLFDAPASQEDKGSSGMRSVVGCPADVPRERAKGSGTAGAKNSPGDDPDPSAQLQSEALPVYGTMDTDKITYRTVTDSDQLEACAEALRNSKVWSFDTETTSTDPMVAELLGISFSANEGDAWYVVATEFRVEELKKALEPLFLDESGLKVAHHFKYDYRVLARHGIRVKGPIFDTMLAAYLLDTGQKMDMDSLSRSYLNYDPVPIESLIGEKGKDQKSMKDVPIELVSRYACEDADVTLRLYRVLDEKMRDQGLAALGKDIEFPLARILGDMEAAGIKINLDLLSSFSEELDQDIEQIRSQIFELTGEEFNINSTQQLGIILFEKMKIPTSRKTATGRYSTSEQVLSQLAPQYEIAKRILEYRGLSKLKSTYVDALPRLVNDETGRIHSTFNQHVAATGRLSSTNPNLQNIPVRTERGRGIRKAFVAEPGFRLLAADYSQVELRIIASMSGDEAMISAFRNNEDIHARTAAEIFGLGSIDEVDRDQRRKAKEVNFGIPYGVSAFGLAQRLGVSNNEGRSIIEAYFDRFPAIRKFIIETIEFARDKGYVETLSGRRRYIPDIHSANPNIRGFAERTAVNMPIQGTAADLIKIAMIAIDRELSARSSRTRMLMQVHDELVFEVPEDELDEIPELVRTVMEQAMELKVPLGVDTGVSGNWLDSH
jgi:DNA polymerase I